MKRLSLLLVLLTLTLTARADEASRRAKAQEMLTLLRMDRMATQMMDGIKQQMTAASKRVAGNTATPEKQQQLEAFQQRAFTLVEAQISWKNLEPEYVDIYAKNFTEEELNGILAFYKSPVGTSLLTKLPQLTSEGMQLAQTKLIAIQPQLKQLFDDFGQIQRRRTHPAHCAEAPDPMTESLKTTPPLLIGVLALQGAYDAHVKALTTLGAATRLVRTSADLDGLDGLIMPGGESTTMLKFLERHDFFAALQSFVRSTPTFGTCAGAILLATLVEHPAQRSLAALDITVERNAYGRQNDSIIFLDETALPGGPLEMVFIRAPRITRVGDEVKTLATRDGFPTLIRQGHLLAATFHPELSEDSRVHQHFLDLVQQHT